MMIEQALHTELAGATGLTALVGERIYFRKAPQDVSKPYLVFFKVSAPREHSHDGASGLVASRWQFSCFATSYKEAKDVVQQVQAELQAFSGVMGGAGGVYVGAAFYMDENDYYESGARTESDLYHIAADYRIWHEE